LRAMLYVVSWYEMEDSDFDFSLGEGFRVVEP